MTDPANPRLKRPRAAMPEADSQFCLPRPERFELASGQVLYEPGVMPNHVLFPTRATVSLMQLTGSVASAEIATVGNDGLVRREYERPVPPAPPSTRGMTTSRSTRQHHETAHALSCR